MAAPFAGGRRKGDLGRSVSLLRGLFLEGEGAPVTMGALWTPRRGTLSARRQPCAGTLRFVSNAKAKDTSFTRSRGPCTSIVTTLRRRKSLAGGALAAASRSGKPTQVGRTGTEAEVSGRSAARRASTAPGREAAWRAQKRKEVAASVPARKRELGSKCPHVGNVAEVGKRRLVSNTLARSAPKRVAARVNGDLALRTRRR